MWSRDWTIETDSCDRSNFGKYAKASSLKRSTSSAANSTPVGPPPQTTLRRDQTSAEVNLYSFTS